MTAGESVYLVAAKRTPIGMERGALGGLDAAALAAAAVRGLLADGMDSRVGRVVLANVGGQGNVARYAALAAGLPADVPAVTLNAQCTGGMAAARMAVEAIRAGAVECVVAGGTESVSRASVWLGPGGARRGGGGERLPRVQHAPLPYGDPEMGAAADALAARLGVGREEQDRFAIQSASRAVAARDAGRWRDVIVPVEGASGPVTMVELPRRVPSAALLARLRPAFVEGGTVTAGNTAPLGDGAAALLFASEGAVDAWGWEPLARVVAAVGTACDPAEPPLAAISAAEAALAAADIARGDIGRWEVNEAFAAKAIAFARHFGLDPAVVNHDGGALAFGHPFAASGAILLAHLAADAREGGWRYALAAIAGAGGLGEAFILAPPWGPGEAHAAAMARVLVRPRQWAGVKQGWDGWRRALLVGRRPPAPRGR